MNQPAEPETIADAWEYFAAGMPFSEIQRRILRDGFYAGAASMFVFLVARARTETTAEANDRMTALYKELQAFVGTLPGGRMPMQ